MIRMMQSQKCITKVYLQYNIFIAFLKHFVLKIYQFWSKVYKKENFPLLQLGTQCAERCYYPFYILHPLFKPIPLKFIPPIYTENFPSPYKANFENFIPLKGGSHYGEVPGLISCVRLHPIFHFPLPFNRLAKHCLN